MSVRSGGAPRTARDEGASRTGREPSGTQSVDRALALLTHFTPEDPERRISELVAVSGLGQSTVSRLVGALENIGLLAADNRSGLYRVGPRAVELSALALNQSDVFRAGRQHAQSLCCELGLGANLAERSGDRLFYLCHFDGAQAPRNYTMVGPGGPLHATALGKALLVGMSDVAVGELLGDKLPAFTPHTKTSMPDVLAELELVRSRGYATEREELAFSRACLAAPIWDRSGQVVAAISVSGPLSVTDLDHRERDLSLKVIEAAAHISTALGHNGINQRP
ncbi:IclR family transcriptional regulator [Propionibacteriaceae bacterium Y2011]|uniref:IclR family transcriptional regulator n=1 Tax=Microlunatus sp. Y2014 TaxID=3418488 RepID=UPI003B4BCF38